MFKKCYWYKINSNGKDVGSGVTKVWFWQDALDAHNKAIGWVENYIEPENFSFSEFKRIK